MVAETPELSGCSFLPWKVNGGDRGQDLAWAAGGLLGGQTPSPRSTLIPAVVARLRAGRRDSDCTSDLIYIRLVLIC